MSLTRLPIAWILSISVSLLIYGPSSCAGQSAEHIDTGAREMLASPDVAFAVNAAQAGLSEVKLGQLAAEKGGAPDVKAFGQQMVDNHSKSNDRLALLARKRNMTLPQTLASNAQAEYDKLKLLSGDAFDNSYVRSMVKYHEHDVKAFAREAKKGKDDEIKNFASETSPVLEEHLDKIKGIQAKRSSRKSSM